MCDRQVLNNTHLGIQSKKTAIINPQGNVAYIYAPPKKGVDLMITSSRQVRDTL